MNLGSLPDAERSFKTALKACQDHAHLHDQLLEVRQAECHDKLEKLLVPFFYPSFFLPFFVICLRAHMACGAAHVCIVVPRMCALLPFVVRFFLEGGNMCFLEGDMRRPCMDARVR